MTFQQLLTKINDWRVRHISNRNFLVIASLLVGIVAGIAAIVLKYTVHGIQYVLEQLREASGTNYLYFIFPLIGILLTVYYVQRFRGGKLGRGTEERPHAGRLPQEHLHNEDPDMDQGHQSHQQGCDHAAGIRVSAISAYQEEPKGIALSSKL